MTRGVCSCGEQNAMIGFVLNTRSARIVGQKKHAWFLQLELVFGFWENVLTSTTKN